MVMGKIKLYTAELTKGMYVCELDRPWLDTPFLFQGFLVKSNDELNQLRDICAYVYVDVEKSKADVINKLLGAQTWGAESGGKVKRVSREATRTPNSDNAALTSAELERKEFYDELRLAKSYYDKTHQYIEQALEDVRLGRAVDTRAARRLVGELAESIVRNYSALVWLTNLKERDEYTTTHCINVCILTLSLGRCLGIKRGLLNIAGLGALLHDLGKMKVPLDVLNKPGKLTKEEFEIMKGHPVHGFDLLKGEEGLHEEVLKIVRSHHERLNGGGYPDGLSEQQISKLTRMVSIVDVYDAVTSDRVYHDGMPPHEAIKLMYNWAPKNFDQKLVEVFIRCIGIYPVGSLVELTTGHVGVVVRTDTKSRLRPVVILVLDGDKKPYETRKFINLASSAWQAQADPPEIQHILEKDSFGINTRAIIEQECNSLGLPDTEL